MLVNAETALHRFCARILGWTADREVAVEHAVRSIELALDHSAALVLLGEADLVPIAHALHRRTLGLDASFTLVDPHHRVREESARSPANQASGVAAFHAAHGGTLCVRASCLPDDLSSIVALLRNPGASVQLIVCADARFDTHPFLALPVPILVPVGDSIDVPMLELCQLLAGSRGAVIVARRLTGAEPRFLERRRADCDADVHARLHPKEAEQFRRPRRRNRAKLAVREAP